MFASREATTRVGSHYSRVRQVGWEGQWGWSGIPQVDAIAICEISYLPYQRYLPQQAYSAASSPSLNRAKREMVTFSPVFDAALATICLMVTSGSRTEG
jgi:hypothetical protein